MTPAQILKKYWGYDAFRPMQSEIIDSILAGNDTLGLMPTGGGKSVTFQVPALILPGLTIVVTPLISLMKDQVDNLKSRNVRAATLYSGMTLRERNLVFDKARLGKIKLLYVSPERLRSENFRTEMRGWNVSLIVVDEAHCISQWGYDFRPSYLHISHLRTIFPAVPVLALTASATPVVRNDIVEQLAFRPGYKEFALSFHRHNLSYVVRNQSEKESKLIEALTAVKGCAIVYVRSRRATATYADILNQAGISATFYHAGLDPITKEQRQQAWKEGHIRVMVATNAFGMGIDKPDVRVVVHMDVPPSLEEYYQEAGRAGRDGKHSYALLIASPRDKASLTRHLNAAFPPKEFIVSVYEKACVFMGIAIGDGYGLVYEFNPETFCRRFNFDPEATRGALSILTNAGYFDYNEDPTTRARVFILLHRDEFYTLRLEDNETKVINALLRLYPGLFADYVHIDENTIARMVTMTDEDVYQTLLALKRKKIIDYVPKRVLPYIYLPTSRELNKYITIPRSVYEERKALMEKRIDAVRRFAFGTEVCRDKILLEYFGEKDACDCGFCDVCVARRKKGAGNAFLTKSQETEAGKTIIEMVKANPAIELKAVVKKSGLSEEIAVEIIRDLISTGKLQREGNTLVPKQ